MSLLKKVWNKGFNIFNHFNIFSVVFYTKKWRSFEAKHAYQKRFVNFNISKNDKVLDVGSGGEPFPFATHLVDKYPEHTQHRYNDLKTNNLPFTEADVQKLPFKNKEFDFVYCAHVIEHVNSPSKACDELMRVGKRGYIEVPTRISDIMFNFAKIPNFHRWYVKMVGNTLIFIEYSDYEKKDTGDTTFFNMAHSKINNPIKRMYRKNKNLFSNMFLWKDGFNYYVYNKAGKLIKYKNQF